MLVLTRQPNQDIVIPTFDITVKVLSVQGGKVRIGIEAPRDIAILRGEVAERDAADFPALHTNRILQLV